MLVIISYKILGLIPLIIILSYLYIWLVVFRHPSEKYAQVSWDDDIPNIRKNKKMFQTTNQ